MILVTTCESINESMVQLIFQLIIIMTREPNEQITMLQVMVVSWSLFMASKGPAEDFWAARMKREKRESEEAREGEEDKTLKYYHDIDFLRGKLPLISK